MRFPIGSMTVGDVLDRGVRLLIGRLPLLLGINLIVLSPLYLITVTQPYILDAFIRGGRGPDPQQAAQAGIVLLAGYGIAFLAFALFMPLGVAATLTVTINEYLGRKTTINEAIGNAFRHFFPLLGTSLLFGLLFFLGYIACCIPGIYVSVIYIFASQIVVAESTSGMPALNRSSNLVSGHWWRIFGVVVLIGIISGIIQSILIVPFAVFWPGSEQIRTQNGFTFVNHPHRQAIQAALQIPIGVAFHAFTAVCTTLLYLDMRIRKEGLDLQIAAEQLDQGGGEAQ